MASGVRALRIGRVVVLGHSGFIGGAVLRRLRATRPEVEVVGLSLGQVDLATPEGAKAAERWLDRDTAILMCAAIKRQLGDSPDIYLRNTAIAVNFANLIGQHPVARVVYLSSAAVYGEDIENLAITEVTPFNARTYYGLSKQTAEWILARTAEAHPSMSLGLVRPATIYGPGDLGTAYGPSGFLDAAMAGRPITLWGDGSELREFLFIDDVAAILADYAFMDHGGPLNLVAGTSYSFHDALEAVRAACGGLPEVTSRPRSKSKVDNRFDNRAFRQLFPGFAFTPLAEGVARMRASRSAEGARA